MNARYYLPSLGRFASADSIVPDPMNPQSFNRYTYVNNSPLNMVDPSGHGECDLETLDCSHPTRPDPTPVPFVQPLSTMTLAQGFDANAHPGADYDDTEDHLIRASARGVVRVSDACRGADECDGVDNDDFEGQWLGMPDPNWGLGNVVIIEYGYAYLPLSLRLEFHLTADQSLYFQYAHLANGALPALGSEVNAGTVIGMVGNIGNSTDSHLHLAIHSGPSDALNNLDAVNSYDVNERAWHADDMGRENPEDFRKYFH